MQQSSIFLPSGFDNEQLFDTNVCLVEDIALLLGNVDFPISILGVEIDQPAFGWNEASCEKC